MNLTNDSTEISLTASDVDREYLVDQKRKNLHSLYSGGGYGGFPNSAKGLSKTPEEKKAVTEYNRAVNLLNHKLKELGMYASITKDEVTYRKIGWGDDANKPDPDPAILTEIEQEYKKAKHNYEHVMLASIQMPPQYGEPGWQEHMKETHWGPYDERQKTHQELMKQTRDLSLPSVFGDLETQRSGSGLRPYSVSTFTDPEQRKAARIFNEQLINRNQLVFKLNHFRRKNTNPRSQQGVRFYGALYQLDLELQKIQQDAGLPQPTVL